MQRHFLKGLRNSCFLMGTLLLVGCSDKMSGILNPKGIIAFKERALLFDSLALMLIVVIPVSVMSFTFLYVFFHKRKKLEYRPNWSHNNLLEAIWWGVPIAIIMVLGIMTWTMTHELDPYRKIDNVAGETLKIQTVALPWQWLFIYPDQNIATVNELTIPRGRQVEFLLTTDNVPMSAFFIPQLGSQIYTMAGMRTRLHLVPTHLGTYRGMNTQYNGEGFSEMQFDTKVVTEKEFNAWARQIKRRSRPLSVRAYAELRQPTIAKNVQTYSSVTPDLFQTIIKSYKAPEHPTWK